MFADIGVVIIKWCLWLKKCIVKLTLLYHKAPPHSENCLLVIMNYKLGRNFRKGWVDINEHNCMNMIME